MKFEDLKDVEFAVKITQSAIEFVKYYAAKHDWSEYYTDNFIKSYDLKDVEHFIFEKGSPLWPTKSTCKAMPVYIDTEFYNHIEQKAPAQVFPMTKLSDLKKTGAYILFDFNWQMESFVKATNIRGSGFPKDHKVLYVMSGGGTGTSVELPADHRRAVHFSTVDISRDKDPFENIKASELTAIDHVAIQFYAAGMREGVSAYKEALVFIEKRNQFISKLP